MHHDLTAVSISVDSPTEDNMKAFCEAANAMQDATIEYINLLSDELKISTGCASDVYYLRTRSRWTPELEAELIRLHAARTPPNMCEFGCK